MGNGLKNKELKVEPKSYRRKGSLLSTSSGDTNNNNNENNETEAKSKPIIPPIPPAQPAQPTREKEVTAAAAAGTVRDLRNFYENQLKDDPNRKALAGSLQVKGQRRGRRSAKEKSTRGFFHKIQHENRRQCSSKEPKFKVKTTYYQQDLPKKVESTAVSGEEKSMETIVINKETKRRRKFVSLNRCSIL